MISYDIIWYRKISYDTIWYHMKSYDTMWYHMIQYDIKWYHITSHDIIWYHMISYDIIWSHILSYDIIWYHTAAAAAAAFSAAAYVLCWKTRASLRVFYPEKMTFVFVKSVYFSCLGHFSLHLATLAIKFVVNMPKRFRSIGSNKKTVFDRFICFV